MRQTRLACPWKSYGNFQGHAKFTAILCLEELYRSLKTKDPYISRKEIANPPPRAISIESTSEEVTFFL